MIMPTGKPEEGVPQAVLDELNRRLAAVTHIQNTTPAPEMGGLSPDQVTRLIYAEWGEAGGAVQFNMDIPLAELQTSEFFREARTLLKALLDSGGVRATTSKNLARRFVSDVLPLMCNEKTLAEIWKYNKIVNEQDVRPLHIARVVAQAAGLIRLYKGKFMVPKTKAALLSEKRAGELFRCLFVAFLRKFNLAYARYTPEMPSVQTCAGYTLYRLGMVAGEWRQVEDLPADVLLPLVGEEIEAEIRGHIYWTTDKLLVNLLISPLIGWGLLHGRYEQESKFLSSLKAVRITSLYQAFLRFSLDG